jgi:hypothetical protein
MAGTLSLPTLLQRVRLDTSDVQKNARSAEGSLTRAGRASRALATETERAGRGFRGSSLAIAAGATLVLAGIRKAIHVAEDYAGTIRKLSSFTGESAENSSKLAFVLGRFGIDANAALRPIAILSKTIQQGGGHLKDFFDETTLARFKTQPLIETLLDINDKYHSLNTAQEKNALLQVAVGRGAISLRRFFSATREEITRTANEAQRFGLVLTQDNLDAFKRFSDGERELGQAVKGLQVQIGLALIPLFEKAAEGTTVLLTEFQKLSPGIKTAAVGILTGVAAIGLLSQALSFLKVGATIAALRTAGAAAIAFAGDLFLTETSLVNMDLQIGVTEAELAGLTASMEGGTIAAAGMTAALAGVAGALVAGLAIGTEINKHFVAPMIAAKEAEHDLHAQTAANIAVFKELNTTGRITDGAYRTITKTLEDMRRAGQLTDEAQEHLFSASAITLIRRTAAAHGDVVTVMHLLAEGHEDAARKAAAHAGAEANVSTALEGETAQVLASIDATRADIVAKDAFTATLDKVGARSTAGQRVIEAYTRELLAQHQAEIDGAKDGTEKQKIIDGITKSVTDLVSAEEEQRKKAIEANTATIASFDKLSESVKGSAEDFRIATAANTQRILDFVDDLKTIAARGAPALASELSKMGPAASKAARQAAQAGGKGLATLEDVARDAVVAAKKQADAKFDEWDPNFRTKGAAAGTAAVQGTKVALSKIGDMLNNDIGPIVDRGAQEIADNVKTPIIKAGGEVVEQLQKSTGEVVTVFADARGRLNVQTQGIKGDLLSIATVDFSTTRIGAKELATALGIPLTQAQKLLDKLNAIDGLHVSAEVGLKIDKTSDKVVLTGPMAPAGHSGEIVGITTEHRGGWIMHAGGRVPRMHDGGLRNDERMTILQTREFVVRRSVAERNRGNLEALNATGQWPTKDLLAMIRVMAREIASLLASRQPPIFNVSHSDPWALSKDVAYLMGVEATR